MCRLWGRVVGRRVLSALCRPGLCRAPRPDEPGLPGVEAHAADMRERGFVGHENPDSQGLSERYAAFGLDCPGGENVYHSPTGGLASSSRVLADHVVDAWTGSEGHRGAILKDRFDRQGVGVAVGPDGGVWVTQDFC
ncbi:MAG: CAP domain-containing protein [Haloarculaceae archaeon]